jgi:23S rRNA U2552 (ribose-2'-O)-methylase RlmE/FtsJ
VAVRSANGRSSASQRWLARQLNDPYVAAAKQQGWRSRAAFKLLELDDRFHLIRRGALVVDLGASPGGWSQVAVKRGAAKVVGLDLLPVDPVAGATMLLGDLTDPTMPNRLATELGGRADNRARRHRPSAYHGPGRGCAGIRPGRAGARRCVCRESVPGRCGAADARATQAALRERAACQATCQPQGVERTLRGGDRVPHYSKVSGIPSRSSARSTLISTAKPFLSGSRSFSGCTSLRHTSSYCGPDFTTFAVP